MNQTTLLECIVKQPEQPAKASVIWLHGLGADGHDFTGIIPALQLPADMAVRFIFPHAPMRTITLNNHQTMRAWYDIYQLGNLSKEDIQGIKASRIAIDQLIQHEHQQGIPFDKIMLAGFSQGGAMALHIGLTYAHKLAGIIALSCYLPLASELIGQRNTANATTPIFQAHGDTDPMIPINIGHACYQFLQKINHPISWHHYPIAHSVSEKEIQDIGIWMQQQINA